MDPQVIDQATAHAPVLNLLAICLIIAIGGALGGLAQSVNRFSYWPPQDVTQISRIVDKTLFPAGWKWNLRVKLPMRL